MRKLNKYIHIFKISLSNNLVYFWNFLIRNLFFLFIIYIFLMLWGNIYGQKGDVIKSFDIIYFFILIEVAIIWVVAAYTIFYKGLKKYESGNLITAKL